jgi:molybdate transport system ATP-binding protein
MLAAMIEVDVEVERGEFRLVARFRSAARLTALFGRSGAGKSSLIAAVAGLLRPVRGRIAVDGTVLYDGAKGIMVPARKRRIGLVFQDSLLFPHLTVAANLDYGRWFARGGDGAALDRGEVVAVLGIGALLGRRPSTLSGGERQRVAIGRALLSRPRLLLLDEPLASLDAARKSEILALVEEVRDAFGVPILYVSHAAAEVARLAGHVVVVDGGAVVAEGPPGTVLPLPGDPGRERFDAVSLIAATIAAVDERYGLTVLDHPAGAISVPGVGGRPGQPARVVVAGSDVALAREPPRRSSVRTVLAGHVAAATADDGPIARVDVALEGGDRLAAFVTRKSLDELGLAPGAPVFALVKAASLDTGLGTP